MTSPSPIFRNLARGFAHTSLGICFAVGLLLFPKNLVVAVSASLTGLFILAELARFVFPRFREWLSVRLRLFLRAEEGSKVSGATYFLIGGSLTAALFPSEIAVIAILFLAFGDPSAGLVGRWKSGKRMWRKSLEGNLACLVVCLAVSAIAAPLLGKPELFVVFTGAVFATLFQAIDLRLNDNVTIPLGSAAAMLLLTQVLKG